MKLNFKRLRSGSPEFSKIRQLYNKAFPSDERAPFLLLVLNSRKKGVDFWSVSCDGRWAGMLYVVNYKDLSYLFYLAVDEEQRGNGIGSAVLRSAQKLYNGRRLFLAIEQLDENADNYEERVHRKNFYLRNGFSELGHKLREGKVIYEILGVGGEVSGAEYKALITGFAGSIITKLFTMEFVD